MGRMVERAGGNAMIRAADGGVFGKPIAASHESIGRTWADRPCLWVGASLTIGARDPSTVALVAVAITYLAVTRGCDRTVQALASERWLAENGVDAVCGRGGNRTTKDLLMAPVWVGQPNECQRACR
jgi:hypothetical protein